MKTYMQMLVWIMLFVIVVEMIFPDSNYKKYIKLVLGCVIVYTMMKPVIAFIPLQGKSYDAYVMNYQNQLLTAAGYGGAEESYKVQLRKQQEFLKTTYSQNIKQLVERETDVSVKEVEIKWQDNNGMIQIDQIYLTVGDKQKSKKNTIAVPKIRIGEKSSSLSGDEEKLKIKIKTCLNNFYNVQTRNIYITVQKN